MATTPKQTHFNFVDKKAAFNENESDHLMAELHILGYVRGTTEFQNKTSLFCRYSFQAGPNWTIVTGLPEGQTVTGKVNQGSVVWSHPLDLHYITRGIQGWPKILFQVGCLDSLGRSWVEGYSYCSIPSVPGHHELEVPCWAPAPTTFPDRLRQYFLGGSHQLLKTDVINLGVDRFKLKTESKGNIKLDFDIVLRSFSKFGVEYK